MDALDGEFLIGVLPFIAEELVVTDVPYTVRDFLLKAGEYLECICGAGILKDVVAFKGWLAVLALLAKEL